MNKWHEKIDKLDPSLFETIFTQTSAGDRRSLLAVQRATARKYKEYSYLEIGSHLGGTIQPHLVDDRCKRIYSIDPRPSSVSDDRSPGAVFYYDNNSTARMLTLLSGVGNGDVSKVECFDLDASEVDPGKITNSPQIVFIDGEHTMSAALSDFQFCMTVASEKGTILFHDFCILYPAILEICDLLNKQHHTHVALKLEGEVFGIFFDTKLVHADSYLASLHKRSRRFWFGFHVKKWMRQHLPAPLVNLLRGLRNVFRTPA
jgi:hypothetical protein